LYLRQRLRRASWDMRPLSVLGFKISSREGSLNRKPDTYRPGVGEVDRRDCGPESVGSTEFAARPVRYES
jgi:hypothetical protein